jgi:FkbM family methyltransferase
MLIAQSKMMQKVWKGAAVSEAIAMAIYLGMRKVPLSFWDVGARGGLSRPMEVLYRVGVVRPIFFEPDPLEASTLTQRYECCKVFNCALWDKDGEATLYLTGDPGCSSLLRPVKPLEMVGMKTIPTARADTLLTKAEPEYYPEILKADVQGGELTMLKGFGKHLNRIVCIELEVSFQKAYEGQFLIESVTDFLLQNGFGLIDIRVFGVRSTRSAPAANAFYVRRELENERQVAVERVFRCVNRISLAF